MTLVVDHRDALGGKPGVHVLIVGVSDLPYCSGFGHPAEETFGLLSLEGHIGTAFPRLARAGQEHLPQPLATVRLLVSSRNGNAVAGAEKPWAS